MTDLHVIQGGRPDKELGTDSLLEVTIYAVTVRPRRQPHARATFQFTEREYNELLACAFRIKRRGGRR